MGDKTLEAPAKEPRRLVMFTEVRQQCELFSGVPQVELLVFQRPKCLRLGRLGRLWIHGWLNAHPAAATLQRRLNGCQRHHITTTLYTSSGVEPLPYFAMASPWHCGVGKYSVQRCSDRQCQGYFWILLPCRTCVNPLFGSWRAEHVKAATSRYKDMSLSWGKTKEAATMLENCNSWQGWFITLEACHKAPPHFQTSSSAGKVLS